MRGSTKASSVEADVLARMEALLAEQGYLTKQQVGKLRSAGHRVVPAQVLLPLASDALRPYLRVKSVRTASGVAVVALMSKPHRCPHALKNGQPCLYCPGGVDSPFEESTQSYTGFEPTSLRAVECRYDPERQIRMRVQQLEALGHETEKIEVILMGGTFMCLGAAYRREFIRKLHDSISGHSSVSLPEAILYAGYAVRHRCVALTIETRPDLCSSRTIAQMLQYGATRLEIGVQTLSPMVMQKNLRGHTVPALVAALAAFRAAGFKLAVHMMPNLHGATPLADVRSIARLGGGRRRFARTGSSCTPPS